MECKNKELLVLNVFVPVYEPHSGGGAIFFPLLARQLSANFFVNVYTERHPDKPLFENPHSDINVHRCFFQRDTRGKKNLITNSLLYFINHFLFLFVLLGIIFRRRSQVILFTRNYHFGYIFLLRVAKKIRPDLKLINDYRTAMPRKHLKLNLNFFDWSISNSLSIETQLSENPHLMGKNHKYIPNIIELPHSKKIKALPLELQRKKIAVFCGTLSFRKSFDIVLPVLFDLRKHHGLYPVIIGREVDFTSRDVEQHFSDNNFAYFSYLCHEKVLSFLNSAAIVILPSRREGLPRVALETLALHGRIVLPPCCPEFSEELPMTTFTKEQVYKLALKRMTEEYTGYNIKNHDLSHFSKYVDIVKT